MPTNLSVADASFPQLTEKQSTDEKIEKIQSYLYMLLESLRFQLSNIEKENFNDTAFEEISDIITEPVYAQISDVEGNVTSLALKADGLSLQIQNAEGDISTLVSRADILASQMTDAQGNISTLTQQSDALTTRVSNSEGDISSLQQTARSLSSRVSNNEGDISSLWQTASSLSASVTSAQNTATAAMSAVNGITLSASSGEKSSTLTIKSGSTTLSSATIEFDGEVVFKSDLSTKGSTTINGGNITTGTMSGYRIYGGQIEGVSLKGQVLNIYGEGGGSCFNLYRTDSDSAAVFAIEYGDFNAAITSPGGYDLWFYTKYINFSGTKVSFNCTVDFTNATVVGLN